MEFPLVDQQQLALLQVSGSSQGRRSGMSRRRLKQHNQLLLGLHQSLASI
jgi:hypothetical protein